MSWDKRPTDLMLEVDDQVATVRNERAKFGLRMLVERTPVDTGLAVGKWRVHVRNEKAGRSFLSRAGSRIASAIRSVASRVTGLFRTTDTNTMRTGQQALAEGLAVIESSKKSPYAEIAMINDSDYLHFVNNGTRFIRPRRFVESVMNDIRVYFR